MPVAAAVIGLAVGIGGAVASSMAAMDAGNKAREAGERQEELFNQQADYMEDTADQNLALQQDLANNVRGNADFVRKQTEQRVGDIFRAGASFQSTQRQSIGKAGIKLSGSAVAVMNEAERAIKQDATRTREEGFRQAGQLDQQAGLIERQAEIDNQAVMNQADMQRAYGEEARLQGEAAQESAAFQAAAAGFGGTFDAMTAFAGGPGASGYTPMTLLNSSRYTRNLGKVYGSAPAPSPSMQTYRLG